MNIYKFIVQHKLPRMLLGLGCITVSSYAFCQSPATQKSEFPLKEQPSPLSRAEEIATAVPPLDRDSRISHLWRAINLDPENPDNVVLRFRIATMLTQNPDIKHGEPVHPLHGLAVLKDILSRYDHKSFYSDDPPDTGDAPQILMPRAAILAASLERGELHEFKQAKDYSDKALEYLAWTYRHRRERWSTAPEPTSNARIVALEGNGRFESQRTEWQRRSNLAKNGDISTPFEHMLIRASLREYVLSEKKITDINTSRLLHDIGEKYQDTPIAAEATVFESSEMPHTGKPTAKSDRKPTGLAAAPKPPVKTLLHSEWAILLGVIAAAGILYLLVLKFARRRG